MKLFDKKSSAKSLFASATVVTVASFSLLSFCARDLVSQEENPSNNVPLTVEKERALWQAVVSRDVSAIEKNLPLEAHDSISREQLGCFKITVNNPDQISLRECHGILKSALGDKADRLSYSSFVIGNVSGFLRSRSRDRDIAKSNGEFVASLPEKVEERIKGTIISDSPR